MEKIKCHLLKTKTITYQYSVMFFFIYRLELKLEVHLEVKVEVNPKMNSRKVRTEYNPTYRVLLLNADTDCYTNFYMLFTHCLVQTCAL